MTTRRPLRVEWSGACESDVLRIHWLAAHRVCTAVMVFARTGVGPVEIDQEGDPSRFRVRVPGAVALARFDGTTGVIFVDRINRAR